MKIRIKNRQSKIPISPRQIIRIARAALASERVKPNCELSILFVSDKFIKSLNKKYLNTNRPTDVLAFQIDLKKPKNNFRILGDVVISCETVYKNSRVFNKSPNKELIFCLVHGILHLLGHSDYTKKTREAMFKKQDNILKKMKIR